MDSLTLLDNSVRRLLGRIAELEQQVTALQQDKEDQRQEIVRTHGELAVLQDKYRKLQLAHAMLGGDEDRQYAKNQITNMISQVDRAIEVLKQ